MKFYLSLAAVCLSIMSYAQCTLSGLNSFYCTSDTGSQLTASCGGSSATIFGPGVNSSGYFNPAQLQDSIPIIVVEGTTTYTIDQSLPFNPDTSSGGTNVSLTDDQVSAQLQIGFSFRFFDNVYTTFQISSNGFITFGTNTSSGCCSGQSIPSTNTPNNFIAHVWNDLYPPGGGSITYKTIGTAPNRRCIIDFDGIPQCCGTSYPRTSQIQLWEGCGRIEIHTTSQPYGFGSSTQGIENSNGTAGYPVSGRNSQGWTATNDYVAFVPNCGDTFWTYVSEGPELTLALDSNDCFFDSNATATVSATGASPYTYSWSTGATTSSITGLPQGTYTVTVTDDDGCSATIDGSVYSPQPLTVQTNTTDAHCESDENGYALANPNGGVTPYSYAWSTGASGDSLGGLAAGMYSVTITDANGCTSTNSFTIDYTHDDPIVNLGDDKNICPGGIALLVTAPGYASYAWSTGDTLASTVIQSAGTYTVTVTSSSGCTASDELVVTEVTPVQVELGPDREGLAPIQVDAGSHFNQFLWSTGSNSQVLNVGASGTYTVTVADTNGCSSTDDIKVSIWPASVSDLEANGFAVYPNPAMDELTIVPGRAYNRLSTRLVDVTGRVVSQTERSTGALEQVRIDVEALPRGTYVLFLHADQAVVQRTIVLK